MKSVCKLSSFAALIAAFSACQQEPGIDPDPSSDSTYVYRMKMVSDAGPGADTANIYFHYDGQKRMNAFSTYGDDGTGNYQKLDTNIFYYQGGSTVPSRATNAIVTNGITGPVETEHFFFYDSQNRKIKDSAISFNGTYTRVINFKYVGVEVYGETRTTSGSPAGTSIGWDTATINGKGDILQGKVYGLDGSMHVLLQQYEYSYDINNGPFRNTSLYQALWGFPNDGELELDYVGKSNIVNFAQTGYLPLPFDYIINATHQYNNLEYCTKSVVQDNSGTISEFYYYYKAL